MTALAPCGANNVLVSIQAKIEGLSSETGKKFNFFKKYRYEMEEYFKFPIKLWDEIIRYGFNPLHKLIRCAENMCKTRSQDYRVEFSLLVS